MPIGPNMPPKKEQKALNEHSRTAELLVELVDDLDLIFTFGYQPFAVMKYGMSGIREMREARKGDGSGDPPSAQGKETDPDRKAGR